jgi:glycosyltransferase involved in cell wall biosynthesis
MRIGLDATGIVENTGLDRYSKRLFEHLRKIDAQSFYILYQRGALTDKIPNSLWEQVILPLRTFINKLDILHTVKNLGLPAIHLNHTRYVLTLCDVIPLKFPQQYLPDAKLRRKYERRLKLSISSADKIVTLSQFSKRDIISTLNIPEESIEVIYPGVDKFFRHIGDKALHERIRNKYSGGENFILGIGADEPRKNNTLLMKAFRKLKEIKEYRKYKLIVVGRRYIYGNREMERVISQMPSSIKNDVIFAGEVTDDDLLMLYNAAEVFVFPSVYEGFGMPVLEAMSCGTPVIMSNATSLPEVAGDSAAITVDPSDEEALTQKMLEVIEDERLRQHLIREGYYRVRLFSWEKAAQQMLSVYRKLVN